VFCAGTLSRRVISESAHASYTDNGNGTVTDNNTGLVWEKLSMDGSVHDVSTTYPLGERLRPACRDAHQHDFACHTMRCEREYLESIMTTERRPGCLACAFNTILHVGLHGADLSFTTYVVPATGRLLRRHQPVYRRVLATGVAACCLDMSELPDNVRGVRGVSESRRRVLCVRELEPGLAPSNPVFARGTRSPAASSLPCPPLAFSCLRLCGFFLRVSTISHPPEVRATGASSPVGQRRARGRAGFTVLVASPSRGGGKSSRRDGWQLPAFQNSRVHKEDRRSRHDEIDASSMFRRGNKRAGRALRSPSTQPYA